MFKRARRFRQHLVGGKPFEHASGCIDPVSVIAEHSLPSDVETDVVEAPHGYRARTVGDAVTEPRKSA